VSLARPQVDRVGVAALARGQRQQTEVTGRAVVERAAMAAGLHALHDEWNTGSSEAPACASPR
jgi:hypothetical protein